MDAGRSANFWPTSTYTGIILFMKMLLPGVLFVVSFAIACAVSAATNDEQLCGEQECASGQVCVDNTCRHLCFSDLDCPSEEFFCAGDFCVPVEEQRTHQKLCTGSLGLR